MFTFPSCLLFPIKQFVLFFGCFSFSSPLCLLYCLGECLAKYILVIIFFYPPVMIFKLDFRPFLYSVSPAIISTWLVYLIFGKCPSFLFLSVSLSLSLSFFSSLPTLLPFLSFHLLFPPPSHSPPLLFLLHLFPSFRCYH